MADLQPANEKLVAVLIHKPYFFWIYLSHEEIGGISCIHFGKAL